MATMDKSKKLLGPAPPKVAAETLADQAKRIVANEPAPAAVWRELGGSAASMKSAVAKADLVDELESILRGDFGGAAVQQAASAALAGLTAELEAQLLSDLEAALSAEREVAPSPERGETAERSGINADPKIRLLRLVHRRVEGYLDAILATSEKLERSISRTTTPLLENNADAVIREIAALLAEGTKNEPSNEVASGLDQARKRGDAIRDRILSGAEMLDIIQFSRLVEGSPEGVEKLRKAHQVLALNGVGGLRFPTWQLGPDRRPYEAIPTLFEKLGQEPWAVYRFLTQHHPELSGLTGREALRRGEQQKAIEAAGNSVAAFA